MGTIELPNSYMITRFFLFYFWKEKPFQLNILFVFSELCEQSVEIMLTPEMIEVEFPMLDYKNTKKEK